VQTCKHRAPSHRLCVQCDGCVPLNRYELPLAGGRQHSYVTASPQGNAFAQASNYTFVRVEG
jgi:hypothetical protein